MSLTRQLIYDEQSNLEREILSDAGAIALLECYKLDIKDQMNRFDTKPGSVKPKWDILEPQNWDYMICGLHDIYDYVECMCDVFEQIDDKDELFAFNCALDLIDELQQTLNTIFDFVNEDTKDLEYDLDSYQFWGDFYYQIIYIQQCITLDTKEITQ